MSRIIVKNLPRKVSEEKLKSHFGEIGAITDAKLVYKKDGEFRGFAFLGFESEESAKRACAHFKNTYFKQNKITVEMCNDLDYKAKQMAAHTKLQNTRTEERKTQNEEYDEILNKTRELTIEKLRLFLEDPNFVHYLNVNEKGTSDWVQSLKDKYGQIKNDEDDKQGQDEDGKEEDNEREDDGTVEKRCEKVAEKQISDMEYLKCLMKSSCEESSSMKTEDRSKTKKCEDFYTVVIRTREQNATKEKKSKTLTKKAIKNFLRPITFSSLRIPRHLSFVAYVGFKTENGMKQVLMKDKSFLDGVRVRVHKYIKREGDGSLSDGAAPWREAEAKVLKEAVSVADSGRLFVRNLWYSTTEDDLKEYFGKIGPVADVTLPLSKLTRKPKGFCHVTYVLPEHAVRAMSELDGRDFQGRVLHILPSLIDEDKDTEEKSFKDRKKAELKKSASSWHNWNTLFLGSAAVIDLMSQNFATSKQKLLFEDEGKQSAAVTMALGETQIIDETKRFLEEEGISLEAFSESNVQRSATVLLAKNLPAKTSAQELKELFGKFGELGRLVLPPSGITGVIEFVDSGEAKRAFKGLAYSRFKHLPLYLEWAPMSVFTKAVKATPSKNKEPSSYSKDAAEAPPSKNQDSSASVEGMGEKAVATPRFAPEPNTTLYIKNLNFKTEEDAIKQLFLSVGPVSSVLVSRRRGLPQGFGFVQFERERDAQSALRSLQNASLDGHNIALKLSEKKLQDNQTASQTMRKLSARINGETSTKIMVKNIPFQATAGEVRQLFKTFGELKSVRLPNKPGGSEHRGFGFVEFVTKEDAKKSVECLGSSTHLYGRRLVLEWAKEDESVEDIRRRTAEHFLGSNGPANKRQKVELTEKKGNFDDFG